MNMTKSTKTIISVSALCGVLALSSLSAVNAAGYRGDCDSPRHFEKHRKQGGEHMLKRMSKVLSLTEEQQTKIKEIQSQAKEQNQSLRETRGDFKKESKALIHAKTFDEQAFVALQATYQADFAQVELAKAKVKNAIFNVLTAEQQEIWLTKMENRKGKGQGKGKFKNN